MPLKNFLKNTFCTQSFGGLIDCGLTIFQDKTYFYPNVSRTKLLLPKFVRVRIFLFEALKPSIIVKKVTYIFLFVN